MFHIFQFIIDYANVEQITIYIAQSEIINDTPTVQGILTYVIKTSDFKSHDTVRKLMV